MKFEEMKMRDYSAMLITRHQAAQMGMSIMEPWPPDRAARLMAIVMVWGNNEGFTLSPKFNIDREYIQQLYGIDGGKLPDSEFSTILKQWAKDYEAVKDEKDILFCDAKKWISQMYDFQLFM